MRPATGAKRTNARKHGILPLSSAGKYATVSSVGKKMQPVQVWENMHESSPKHEKSLTGTKRGNRRNCYQAAEIK